MTGLLRYILGSIDAFLFCSCEVRTIALFRIGYACLLIINVLVWMIDGPLWFASSGVLSSDVARRLESPAGWSLFYYLPSTAAVIQSCLAVMLFQSCCLLFGCWSRFQAACLFVWLTSFHHRNPLICDGEDTVFRLFAFIMIFLPLDDVWAVRAIPATRQPISPARCWALRLIQAEIAVIYASAAWCKYQGDMWHDGTAVFGIAQMTDYFGRGWIPAFVFQNRFLLQCMSWFVVILEGVLPVTLWFNRTRRISIALGVLFHLMLEYSMNLFLFEWLMMVGLLAFIKTEDWETAARIYRKTPAMNMPPRIEPTTQ